MTAPAADRDADTRRSWIGCRGASSPRRERWDSRVLLFLERSGYNRLAMCSRRRARAVRGTGTATTPNPTRPQGAAAFHHPPASRSTISSSSPTGSQPIPMKELAGPAARRGPPGGTFQYRLAGARSTSSNSASSRPAFGRPCIHSVEGRATLAWSPGIIETVPDSGSVHRPAPSPTYALTTAGRRTRNRIDIEHPLPWLWPRRALLSAWAASSSSTDRSLL